MLFEIMQEIKNFFPTNRKKTGSFVVEGGTISLDFISKGQYFMIEGSEFNDNAVYQYPATDLTDETFVGTVTVLAPPRAFLALAEEIESYAANEKPSDVISESYDGYSRTKANNNGRQLSWKGAFGTRLRAWRKI